MEGRIIRNKHFGAGALLPLLFLLLSVLPLVGCSNEAPPTGVAIENRDSLPVMVTTGVSKLISDSGVVRYKLIAEEWQAYDMTKPPRQVFLKGLFFERFNENFQVDLYITADTAFCYDQNLWELRGRVFVKNFANGTTFRTTVLFWDMGKHEMYSDTYMHIVTPDRDVDGDRFRSNEAMTKYHISQSSGYMPIPQDSGADEPAASVPAVESDTDSVVTVVRPREMPVSKTVAGRKTP